VTWTLWQQGKTVAEIGKERGLAASTILGHLERLMKEGRVIDLSRQLSKDRIALIEEALARAGSERLTMVKTLLPPDVSYEEIRLVMGLDAQRKHAQKGNA